MTRLHFREATLDDLPTIVSMLADDKLGASREAASRPLNQNYVSAFESIDSDPMNELIVVELESRIVGVFQLTFVPYLTYVGSWRCMLEGLRIHSDFCGMGLGEKLIDWAVAHATKRKCRLLQLTSDKQRPDAIRFYNKLGFVASHEGFKLRLDG